MKAGDKYYHNEIEEISSKLLGFNTPGTEVLDIRKGFTIMHTNVKGSAILPLLLGVAAAAGGLDCAVSKLCW